jgi:hypothetical protein
MPEGRGAYVAAFVVIVIIILLLVFFFCSGTGCGSLASCLKACRICAEAEDNQISLGPCCKAKITNSVAQKTTYTLPDPGADAASFLLSVAGEQQTINGNAVVTASDSTGSVAGGVSGTVTANGPSGKLLYPAIGIVLTGNDVGTFTLTNSSITATSSVLLSLQDPTPTTNAQLTAVVVAVADGSATIRVANGGSASTASHDVYVNFLVLP